MTHFKTDVLCEMRHGPMNFSYQRQLSKKINVVGSAMHKKKK